MSLTPNFNRTQKQSNQTQLSDVISIVNQYRYTDSRTWNSLNKALPFIKQLDQNTPPKDLTENYQLSKIFMVTVCHLIWNQNELDFAKSIIKKLSPFMDPILSSMIAYFNGKQLIFENQGKKAIIKFQIAQKAVDTIPKNDLPKLREILQAMGSINPQEPKDIEATVFKAVLHNDLARALLLQGKNQEAETNYSQAFKLQKKSYGTEIHANVAYTLHWWGTALESLNQKQHALEKFKQAKSIADQIYTDPNHPEVLEINKKIQDITLSAPKMKFS